MTDQYNFVFVIALPKKMEKSLDFSSIKHTPANYERKKKDCKRNQIEKKSCSENFRELMKIDDSGELLKIYLANCTGRVLTVSWLIIGSGGKRHCKKEGFFYYGISLKII